MDELVFVGTLTRDVPYYPKVSGKGLLVFSLSEETGVLSLLSKTAGIDNPTYLCVHPSKRRVYAVSEVVGWNEGVVTAYSFDEMTGRLDYLGKQATRGSNSNFVSTDIPGRHVIVANYAHEPWSADCPSTEIPGKAVAVFPLSEDGNLMPVSSETQHSGPRGISSRQDRPHPHCAEPSPDGRFIVVPDLGLDRIYTYKLSNGLLHETTPPFVKVPSGSGPRHFIFKKSGVTGYVVDEIASCVSRYAFDPSSGSLSLKQTVSALPPEFNGRNSSADIHLSPDERFLYVSNRGHNSIAVFDVDPHTDELTLRMNVPSGGDLPRNFTLSKSGRFMIVANQGTDCLAVFERDSAMGSLHLVHSIEVGTPMCVKTWKRPRGGDTG